MIPGVPLGVNVGKNICATKLVHGLFRISDQEQALWPGRGAFRCALSVDSLEDAVLDVISILKFINHGTGIAVSQFGCESGAGGNGLKQLC